MLTPRRILAFVLGFLLAGLLVQARPVADPARPTAAVSVVAPLPPLPDSIISMRGWVKVHRAAQPFLCGDVLAWGCYDYDHRWLTVVTGLDRWREWEVLEHERVHMTLGDAGINAYARGDTTDGIDDAIADAVANERMLAWVAERRN